MTYYGINDGPKRCPFGHDLGPRKISLSWDTEIRKHWLLCNACDRNTAIVLELDAAEWQVRIAGRWVTYEG